MGIDVFEETAEEKEQNIADMIQQGYTYKNIMTECHVSPSTISKVRKARFGSVDDELEQESVLKTETKALRLFNEENKEPIEVAIELDIPTDEAILFYQKYQQLK